MADLEQVASDLNSASQSLQELREKYDGALDLLDNKNTEITAALESAKSNALQEVQTASNTATSQISQLKDASLNAVNEAKNTATSEISSKKDEALGEFSQATSEFNSTKEEALSQIEQAKTEQGEKITALEQAKESITADLNKKAKLLTENLTWNVGSGGDYEDLQTALNEAEKYTKKQNTTITLKLINNITIQNFLNISYSDFSNVIIDGQNLYEIQCNMTSNSETFITGYLSNFPIFKDITIKNTGTSKNGTCISANNNSNFGCYYTRLKINNFNTGVVVSGSSTCDIRGIEVANNSFGISASHAGIVTLDNAKINNNTTGVNLTYGSFVSIGRAIFSGNSQDCNISYNTLTSNGIAFK